MNTKEFVEKNVGKDTIRGRPIRLNRVTLPIKHGKDYAELVAIGDIHLGYPTCREDKFGEMLDWCKETKTRIILMGDLIESGLRDSVGDSVYRQKLNPQAQMEAMLDYLEPVKHLIVGLHCGNHENRITKSTGIDISKLMARILGVPYLRYCCWNEITVGSQKYSVYSQHGTGGSRFKHTKIKRVLDMFAWIKADAIFCGHHHSLDSSRVSIQEINRRNRTVIIKKCYAVMTGSYLDYDKSYAQMAEYPPSEIGSPKVKFFGNERKMYVSF